MIAMVFLSALAGQGPVDEGDPGIARLVPGFERTPWAKAPSLADLARVKPHSPIRGVAGFECGISAKGSPEDCREIAEQPQAMGFGTAAKSLIPKYRLSKADANAARQRHQRVEVWISFGGTEGCFYPRCRVDPPPPPTN